jgi:hypothetical protein
MTRTSLFYIKHTFYNRISSIIKKLFQLIYPGSNDKKPKERKTYFFSKSSIVFVHVIIQ